MRLVGGDPLPDQRHSLPKLQNRLSKTVLQQLGHRISSYGGLVAVGFLICARPTSVRNIRCNDIALSHNEVQIQLTTYKYGTSGSAPRIALRIPLLGPSDPIRSLFSRLRGGCSTEKRIHISRRKRTVTRIPDACCSRALDCRQCGTERHEVHSKVVAKWRHIGCIRSWSAFGNNHANLEPHFRPGSAQALPRRFNETH